MDVVVPVFHLAAQLTGHLRANGLLAVPSVVYMIEFGAHRHWLHPGNDRFLCSTEQAALEVRRATGRPADVTGPVVAPRFTAPAPTAAGRSRRFAREHPGRTPVLMSAGAWGVASRPHATARLLARGGYLPVVLCGHNERMRASLAHVPHTLALGWQDDMPGLMGAARALIDNAGGLTAVQALAAGLPVVSYRPLPGHFAQGARRMAGLGLSDLAPNDAALLAALSRLTRPGTERDLRIAGGRQLFHDKDEPLTRLLAAAATGTHDTDGERGTGGSGGTGGTGGTGG
ncbi:MGDG synthase family glycosyltransferase [Streptomyces griseofuscus]|uniref:MGDG synthase family glycosyltransferase n=1 Tax=Streptomyces griseofuscus TaxID=146922 RepID=UPI003452FFC4